MFNSRLAIATHVENVCAKIICSFPRPTGYTLACSRDAAQPYGLWSSERERDSRDGPGSRSEDDVLLLVMKKLLRPAEVIAHPFNKEGFDD